MTLEEGLTYLNVGWKVSKYARTEGGKLGINTDGLWGFQCKDWVNGYTNHVLGVIFPGNAIDLRGRQNSRSEWIGYKPGFIPEAGDVFVMGEPYGWNGQTYLGHTGVVISANKSNFKSIDQNWLNANLTKGSPPATVTHDYKGFLGVIRPKWEPMKKFATDDDIAMIVHHAFYPKKQYPLKWDNKAAFEKTLGYLRGHDFEETFRIVFTLKERLEYMEALDKLGDEYKGLEGPFAALERVKDLEAGLDEDMANLASLIQKIANRNK